MDKKTTQESLRKMIDSIPVTHDRRTCTRVEVYKSMTESAYQRAYASKKSTRAFLEKAGICDGRGRLTESYKSK